MLPENFPPTVNLKTPCLFFNFIEQVYFSQFDDMLDLGHVNLVDETLDICERETLL